VILGFTPTKAKNIRDLNDLKRKNAEKVQAEYRQMSETVARSLSAFKENGDVEALERANRVFSTYIQSQQGTVDPSNAIKSVSNQLTRSTRPTAVAQTPREKLAFQGQANAYPDIKGSPELKLPAYLQELEVAQMLQQPEVAQRLVKNSSGLENRAVFDLLVQAGLPEELAQALSSGNTGNLRQLGAAQP
jgi:integrase